MTDWKKLAADAWNVEGWKAAAREDHEQNKRAGAEKSPQGNGQKPVLIIDGGELPAVAEKLRDILAESGTLFDRGLPVRVIMQPDGGLPVATTLTSHSVVRLAHQFCRPVKDSKNATLPDRVAALYLDMAGDWRLPRLVGITSSPLLSDDGSIRASVGYDRDAGLYCCNIPELSLPNRPTKQQAGDALATLRLAFRTFPFADATRSFDSALGVDMVDLKAHTPHTRAGTESSAESTVPAGGRNGDASGTPLGMPRAH
jgi:hypothetical protein